MDRWERGWAWGQIKDEVVLRLSGQDALEWLQGQVTNDVRILSSGAPVNFCFCRSTGQIEAIARAMGAGNDILLTTPQECAQVILDRVDQFVVCEDVSVTRENLVVLTIQSWNNPLDLNKDFAGALLNCHLQMPSRRSPGGGLDLLLEPNQSIDLEKGLGQPEDLFEIESMRLAVGDPKWGADIGPTTLPPELGSKFDEGWVSYRKGCYLGQEVLMRIHSRGHTNWTWKLGLAPQPLLAGQEVECEGRSVGKVTSAVATSPFGPIAAVRIRNEAVGHAALQVQSEVGPIPIQIKEFMGPGDPVKVGV